MKRIFLVSSIAFALLFSSPALATQLSPGSKDFTVNPLSLFDIPLEQGQYCGNPNNPPTQNFKLALSSSQGFLNIRWNAKDPGGIERDIGIDCWLNCPASANLQASCAGFQACSYRGPTGDHACSIQGPSYKFDADNRVVCRFFDQVLPSLDLAIQERIFKTSDYEVSVPPITVTVGSPVTVPIDVKSFGILDSSFLTSINPLQGGSLVTVQKSSSQTDVAACGEVGRTFPSVNFLAAQDVTFSILVHSVADPTVCSSKSQCSYLSSGLLEGQCVESKCWKRSDVKIGAGLASLPEYNILGFVMILLASSAVFFLARKRL